MKRWFFAGSIVGAALLLSVTAATQGPNNPAQRTELVDGHDAVAGEVLVKLRDTQVGTTAATINRVNGDRIEAVGRPGPGGYQLIHSRSFDAATLLQLLSGNPDVVMASPNFILHAVQNPNDPDFGSLWGLLNTGQTIGGVAGAAGADIDATQAWTLTTGSRANVVGVVDTGIDYNHPDLVTNVWSAPGAFSVNIGGITINCLAGTHGFNALTNTCNPLDDNDHGTHVSGTIGGIGNNTTGVTGVNWKTRIMGLKFLNSAGSGSTVGAINAIEFAIQAKAAFALTAGADVRVLSNSWGGGGFSQLLLDEINRADTQDMLFVAAAGNNNTNIDTFPFYPAAYDAPNVISVAATDNRDFRASFSNYGATNVDLGAPGVNILSTTRNNTYSFFSGTSMATPHVSGAAALVLSRCVLTTSALKTLLLANVDLISSMTGTTATGGRLNLSKAVNACSSPGFNITANGTHGSVTLAASTPLQVAVSFAGVVNPSEIYVGRADQNQVLWLDVNTGQFVATAAPTYSGSIGTFGPTVAVNKPNGSGLPAGKYWWIFLIDNDTNGVPNGTYLDVTRMIIQ